MTKLDLLIERARRLPQERQDALAVELEFMLDQDEGEGLLADKQWADLRRRAEEDQGPSIPHEQIEAEFLPTRSR